jgi:hypothetical protein
MFIPFDLSGFWKVVVLKPSSSIELYLLVRTAMYGTRIYSV